MRRQHGPGDRGAPCGAPQALEESSHGLALNHSLLRDIKEREAAVGHRRPSGAHPTRYVSVPLDVVPGDTSGCREVRSWGRRSGQSFSLGCAGSVEPPCWAGLVRTWEASPEPGTQSACPALLPVSCQTVIAWLLAPAD